jgi:putative GTP pyrophosphokinase
VNDNESRPKRASARRKGGPAKSGADGNGGGEVTPTTPEVVPRERTGPRLPVDKDGLITAYNLPADCLDRTGLKWDDLEWIYTIHCANAESLQATANYIAERLRTVPAVHSLKVRVKNAEHLVAKVIRKRLDNPNREITPDNYGTEITDLIGLRALHLFKAEWYPIHQFVLSTWEPHEQPKAYYRSGDPQIVIDSFAKAGCRTEEHRAGYRSVHYLLRCQPTKELFVAELQVRTVFEEGWSEIDHKIRYPHSVDDPLPNQFLELFNRAAGIADEMGSFIERLSEDLNERRKAHENALAEQQTKVERLQAQVAKLSITEKERDRLQTELTALRAAQRRTAATLGSVDYGFAAGSLAIPSALTVTPISGRDYFAGAKIGAFSIAPITSGIDLQRTCKTCGSTFTANTGDPTFLTNKCERCRNSVIFP